MYDAHISGITSYGIYAEIDSNHCEGMVPMRDLDDDYYDFDEKNFLLRGRRHHHKYQLGDPIRIRVDRANMERRQLDFVIAKDGDDGKTDAPSASSQHDDTRAAISDMGNIAAEAAKSKARHQGKGRRGSGKKKK